jgi:hypothetical protein
MIEIHALLIATRRLFHSIEFKRLKIFLQLGQMQQFLVIKFYKSH